MREQLGIMRRKPGITGPAQLEGIDMRNPVLLAQRNTRFIELSQ